MTGKLNYTQSLERCALIMSAVEGRKWHVQGKGLRDNADWLSLRHAQIITGHYLDHAVEPTDCRLK